MTITTEAAFTVTLSAAELNAIIACLSDCAEIHRSNVAGELLLDTTADYASVGDIADKLEATLKPDWNLDA